MIRALTVVDEFLPHDAAVALRDIALRQEFGKREWPPGSGIFYDGVSTDRKLPVMLEALESALGCKVHCDLEFWRLADKGHRPTTHIHADAFGSAMAAVYHLSRPGAEVEHPSGTAFWRHKRTGWEALIPDEEGMAEADAINQDGNDESLWEMTSHVGMRFNRLVCYPAFMFHSRYPLETWGDVPAEGRLTWVSFFTPVTEGGV